MLLVTGFPLVAVEKPNILFIFADDQCFDTIHRLGNREVETPNLDRLAKEGTTFTHAYNMGSWSGAVCIPSRTMLNTGRSLWAAQPLHEDLEPERKAGRLWSLEMKRAGYATYMTGKWHVSIDAEKLFDVAKDIRPGMPKDTPEGYNRPIQGQRDPWSPSDPKFGGFWEGGTHWSEVVANHAEDFLWKASTSSNPFFMYLAFNAPHDPRQSPKEFVDRYPSEKIKVPKNFLPSYPYKNAIGCGEDLRDERLAPFPRTEYAVQVNRQEYYAIITHMDAQIGRILEALEASGDADNTYIFFTSDHGLAVGQHGLIGKQNLFDHSVRVPLIVAGPDIARGRTLREPVYLQDVMATCIELAGLQKPDYVEFNSLLPLLRKEIRESAYDAIYGAYLDVQRSVTMGGYKLILYPEIKKTLLYNLRRDPLEMRDLSEKKGSLRRMKTLFARLQELQRDLDDNLDLACAYPELSGS
jgi:choline-sulfatase